MRSGRIDGQYRPAPVRGDGDGAVAFVTYAPRGGGRLELIHIEVPEALSGRGIGSRLGQAVLEHARQHGVGIIPICAFIAGYIERHSEYRDPIR